jgi:hypothetical protein
MTDRLVTKLSELSRGQPLCHDICKLLISQYMMNSELPKSNSLVHKVNVKLYVLYPSVMHWICSHVHSGDVVTVDNCGCRYITTQF